MIALDPESVLLLGGHGLLGGAIRRIFDAAGLQVAAPDSQTGDVRDLEALRRLMHAHRPGLVVNCAARSRVDAAELDPDDTTAVNRVGAHNAALAAAEAQTTLVHISTDYVFDGQTRTPYREHDPTGVPPNHYGRAKLAAEELVRRSCPRHFIVRVAALFGAGRPCFVTWVREQASPAKPLTIVDDRFASPTFTDEVAAQLLPLVRSRCYGTYHAVGEGVATFYDLARATLELSGKDPAGVVPIPDAQLRSPARRATYTALDNHLLRLRGLCIMSPWREALATFLRGTPER